MTGPRARTRYVDSFQPSRSSVAEPEPRTALISAVAVFRYRVLEPIPTLLDARIEVIGDGFLIVDRSLRVADLNRAAETIIGNLSEDGYLIASDEELLGIAPPAAPEVDASIAESVVKEAAALGLATDLEEGDGLDAEHGEDAVETKQTRHCPPSGMDSRLPKCSPLPALTELQLRLLRKQPRPTQ